MREQPKFAHPAEEAFAEFLNRYKIDWEYEPHSFELAHHPDGQISSAFCPDFFFPTLGIYAELTTADPGLNSRKTKKIRKANEIYGIRVVLFCKKDIEALAQRYDLCYSDPRFERDLTNEEIVL